MDHLKSLNENNIFDDVVISYPFEFEVTLGDYKAILSHYAKKYVTPW
jgi:hypothetical protein